MFQRIGSKLDLNKKGGDINILLIPNYDVRPLDLKINAKKIDPKES